jgi:NADH:ubiquinone oxidoreductase subunit 3 (subunit A)
LIGLILVVFAVYSLLPVPWSPGWSDETLEFLKGGIPIVAVLIGLVSFFVGIADIKDKIEAKREEEEERREADQAGARDGGDGGAASS